MRSKDAVLARIGSAALFLAVVPVLGPSQAAVISGAALPADISALIQAAQRQFDSGNYVLAITTLQSAISQSPSSAEAHYWLGRSYYEIHDYDNAVAEAEKSVALDAKNAVYHQWLGRAYGGKADKERSFFTAKKVKSEFQKAVQLDPSNISARRDLEEYCLDAPWIVGGSKDEASAQVAAIAALDPVEGHLARAVYNQQALRKPDLAENEYRQVLSAKSNRIDPYLEVAGFFVGRNDASDAQAAVDAAVRVSPNDPRIAYFRGVVGVLSGMNFGNAEQLLKSYIASTPDRSDWPPRASSREWLGRLYEAQGKRGEAAEQYRAALELDHGRKEARARLEELEKTPR